MTLLVRDEEDIVDATLSYHLNAGVDFIIATDNGSVDGTIGILRRYEREGWLRLVREPDDNFSQARWVTRMARMAYSDAGATWVIHCDADEFWWPLVGTITSTLEASPPNVGILAAPRFNFIPTPEDGRPFYQRMTVREIRSRNFLGRPLPSKVCHRARPNVEVSQGNHSVIGRDLVAGDQPAPFVIMHYPMRSYSQFESKIVKGGAAYQRNTEVPVELGRGWRLLYHEYLAGRLRAYYDRQVLAEGDIERGIAEGRLIVDRRIEAALSRDRRPSKPARSRDGGGEARPADWHRQAVGGLWEEVGKLQLEYLLAQGLRPEHFLLDVGCGALRGGIHFVRYLQPGHYCGVDADPEILAAGQQELQLAGLADRDVTLWADRTFDLGIFSRQFDFVIAQSLFTHLPLDAIGRCFEAVAGVLAPGGRFYASFFENLDGDAGWGPLEQPRSDGPPFVSYPDRDPYHYDRATLAAAAAPAGLMAIYVGDWGHPRSQRMMLFTGSVDG
jgi:SAM-dependent methyltransferase